MTNAAKQLIDSFEALAAHEQQEVLAQLLRRLTDVESAPLSDDALVNAADAVFQDYDSRERAA